MVAAAVLGVTEPFSCGIGGGGFMTIYRAGTGRVTTIDSREESPAAFGPRAFLDAAGEPLDFEEAVTSGLSVGVPGTVAGWDEALRRYGTWSLGRALRPGIATAADGFRVDRALRAYIVDNAERFGYFSSTRRLFLGRDGRAPRAGSRLENPDLAATYGLLARQGADAFYEGRLARDIVRATRRPPVRDGVKATIRPGRLRAGDLADYQALVRAPTRVRYRGYDVYGMAPPSSGGSTVGEALQILEGFPLGSLSREAALHRYLEASRLAFADRDAYLGDPEFFDVPLNGLLSSSFAAERRALIGERALTSPQDPGNPFDDQSDPSPSSGAPPAAEVEQDGSTTHLTVSDRRGNVVAYTFTIEQIGGSGIVVPGRGFLLNNELTDFDFEPPAANAPEPRKRPRSSMSPTIVLRDGKPVLAIGSPGGSTIITTVLQILVERLDRGATLPEAIAAPRASQRNAEETEAEPGFLASPARAALEARGHRFTRPDGDVIGLASGIELLRGGRVRAAAEPVRGGGGTAGVERR